MCLCDSVFQTFGNNPAPVAETGECCNECNETKLIPASMALPSEDSWIFSTVEMKIRFIDLLVQVRCWVSHYSALGCVNFEVSEDSELQKLDRA